MPSIFASSVRIRVTTGRGRLDRTAFAADISGVMCGRFLNKLPPEEIARWFATKNVAPNYPARFNIAPTDQVLAVRFDHKKGERSLDALRWGLVPHFAKDLSSGARFINARAETVASLPTFRDAFQRRRCLIPASGFYEWRKDGKTKMPYAILPDRRAALRLRRVVGELARPRRRRRREMDPHLHHHHRRAQRVAGADPRPHAGDPAARRLGAMARRGAGGRRQPCKRCCAPTRPSTCGHIRSRRASAASRTTTPA